MPPITVTARTGDPSETSADTRVVGLFEGESLSDESLQALVSSGEASGKLRRLAVTHSADGRRVVVAGLGPRDSFDAESARVAAAVAAARAGELSCRALSWAAPEGAGVAGALVEGTLLALYRFDRFKSKGAGAGGAAGSGAAAATAAGAAAATGSGAAAATGAGAAAATAAGGAAAAAPAGSAPSADSAPAGVPDSPDADSPAPGSTPSPAPTPSPAADEDAPTIESLEIASGDIDVADAVERARVVAESQNAARDLQNLPSNVANPEFLAERASEIASAHDSVSFEAFGRDEIGDMKMGAFMAVAQGSDTEPRLIVLRYDGGSGPHLGYVGKAVTFDTGGISIKPASKMEEMKFDMSGGAAVLESIDAIAALGIPVRVTAVVPSTENMPSGHAMKPGDIVTAMNGKTIEINNTDAEGRLILADALSYAVEQGAERLIDLATLTGAIIVALGSTYAGLFSNDDDWCAEVEAASTATGELGWRLPLHPEFFELTKGKYADLTNASDQRKASSIYAAEFLRQFVADRPWVHVDIAGTAWGQGRAYVGNGASGFGVRMLVELAQRAAAGAPGAGDSGSASTPQGD